MAFGFFWIFLDFSGFFWTFLDFSGFFSGVQKNSFSGKSF